jgi:uncharacterized glyoxalase superfamily protein PhnB
MPSDSADSFKHSPANASENGAMTTTVFPTISFADPRKGLEFLTAVGFTVTAAYWSSDDPTVLDHAELSWPGGGAVMCGSAAREATDDYERRVGAASIYCVVAADSDVDEVHAKALAAGATTLKAPEDQDYGGRSASVRDPEGNQWSFGSYAGQG